jgi:hypothetical protein
MTPPVRRDRLRERGELELVQALEEAARLTPAARMKMSLELSETARALAKAAGGSWSEGADDLEEKARLYAAPLRAVTRHAHRR